MATTEDGEMVSILIQEDCEYEKESKLFMSAIKDIYPMSLVHQVQIALFETLDFKDWLSFGDQILLHNYYVDRWKI